MPYALIIIEQQRSDRIADDSLLNVVSSKFPEGVERPPESDHDDLDAAIRFALKQPCADVPINFPQSRQYVALQVIGVDRRLSLRGLRCPKTSDQLTPPHLSWPRSDHVSLARLLWSLNK